MSDPFLGEIKQVSFLFAPRGWAFCNGQLLSIQQNTALFSLLGTSYGGDGVRTFGLPDLRGRVPTHGANSVGISGGEAAHTLTASELPAHSHTLLASATPSHGADPTGRVLGATEGGGINVCAAADGTATLNPAAISSTGGSQPHNNMQPYAVSSFIIALQGIYPSRN
jgi:microcystin-dependent protein